MKNILLFLLLSISTYVFGQSNYSNGFSDGYKKGFCQSKGINCISPIPPIAPIPTTNENGTSYQDGYNRGFEMGLNAQKSSENKIDRKRYQTAKAEFIEFTNGDNFDKSEMPKMEQRYFEIKDLYDSVLSKINDESKITKNHEVYNNLQEKYLNLIRNLVNIFNNNKISILNSQALTDEHLSKILELISDFNTEMEEKGF